MLHDYINMLDEIKADDVFYQAYYRGVFTKMADRLAEQIEYDYEKQLEKCKKKMEAKERKDDVGEDAMALAVKYSGRGKEAKKEGGETGAKSNIDRNKESAG